MTKFTLKWRLIIPIAIALVIGISVLIIFSAIAFMQQETNLAEDSLINLASEKANLVKSEFEMTIEAIRVLCDSFETMIKEDTAVNIGRDSCTDTLEKVFRGNSRMLSIFAYFKPNAFDKNDAQNINSKASDSTGKYGSYFTWNIDNTDVVLQFSEFAYDDPTFTFTWELKKEFLMEPYVYENIYMTSIFIPIIINGETIGIIGTDISLENMAINFKSEKIFETGNLFLISPEGLMAVHTDESVLGKKLSDVEPDAAPSAIQAMNNSSEGVVVQAYSQISKKRSFYAFSPFMIGDTGNCWAIGINVPK